MDRDVECANCAETVIVPRTCVDDEFHMRCPYCKETMRVELVQYFTSMGSDGEEYVITGLKNKVR